jgi:hypothetical protein
LKALRSRQKFFEDEGGLAQQVNFLFYVLPLQRYHCLGIKLCFMPNPSQNSHILPAVIRRSTLTDYFGQNLHET